MQKRVPENEFLKEVVSIKRDLSELTENMIYCVPLKKKKKGAVLLKLC